MTYFIITHEHHHVVHMPVYMYMYCTAVLYCCTPWDYQNLYYEKSVLRLIADCRHVV